MLDELLISSVTVTVKTWSNVRGQRTVASTTQTTRMASVQPMKSARREVYGVSAGETMWTVYLAADPGVDVQDEIAWNGRSLSVLAPARDQAGRGVAWAVDCRELS
jgi:hypothetical protein